METTDRYAQQSLGVGLLGHPLGHSFSPVIFSHLGEEYKLYDVEKEGAEAIIKSGNFVGLNVTVPHKKTACTDNHRRRPSIRSAYLTPVP